MENKVEKIKDAKDMYARVFTTSQVNTDLGILRRTENFQIKRDKEWLTVRSIKHNIYVYKGLRIRPGQWLIRVARNLFQLKENTNE